MPKVSLEYELAQRQTILVGAAQVFSIYGYGPARMDQICKEVCMSKGALYLYYPSKEALFIAVLSNIYERRYASLAGAFEENDPVDVKFRRILERLCSQVEPEDTQFIRLWVEGFLQSSQMPELEAIKTESHQRFEQLLCSLLREGQESGWLPACIDLKNTAEALMAIADGLLLHSLVPGWEITPERVQQILSIDLGKGLFSMNVTGCSQESGLV